MFTQTHRILSAALIVVVVVLPTTRPLQDADETTATSSTTTSSDWTNVDLETRQKLRQKISCDYEESEFKEVMSEFADKLGVDIILDHTARDDSLSFDDPITFGISEFPATTVLRTMLIEHNATYLVRDGLVRIISLDVADDPEFFARRIIDVNDVLEELSQRESKRIGVADGNNPRVEDLLINTIKKTVGPDNWDTTNGDATVAILGGLMIVRAPEEMADEIEDLLQNLRIHWKAVN